MEFLITFVFADFFLNTISCQNVKKRYFGPEIIIVEGRNHFFWIPRVISDQNHPFWPKFFVDNNFFDRKFFFTNIFFYKIFLTKYLFFTENFFINILHLEEDQSITPREIHFKNTEHTMPWNGNRDTFIGSFKIQMS